ncbi:MAG: hypothetical protein ACK4UQ_04490 [Brevundimonas sp.]
MKLPVLVAVLSLTAVAVPVAAQAQVAAASVPNTFDRPAAQTATPDTTPRRPGPAAVPAATAPANAQSEEVLRTVIADAQAGALNYTLMEAGLATRMREQEAQLLPLIRGFGAVQAVDFVGSREGADLFVVTFASAATQWLIGFDDAGKIDALLFRPAQQ